MGVKHSDTDTGAVTHTYTHAKKTITHELSRPSPWDTAYNNVHKINLTTNV